MNENTKKIHDFLSEEFALGNLRIGFPRMRNQNILIKRLANSGFRRPLFANKREYLRNRIAESFEVFIIIQDLVSIEGVHDGKSVFWDAHGEPRLPEIWANAEVYFDIFDIECSERFVKLILALVEETDEYPIHVAAGCDYSVDILIYLVTCGADVNVRDKTGLTPLHFAASNGNTRNIKYLLNKGAVVDSRADDCSTSLNFAAECASSPDVIKILVDAGADVNAHDTGYWTPLLATAQNANSIIANSSEDATEVIDACNLLLNSGGEVSSSFRKSLTSREYVNLMCQGIDVYKILSDRGENPASPHFLRMQARALKSSLNMTEEKCKTATLATTQ